MLNLSGHKINSKSWIDKKVISFNQWNQIVRNAIQSIIQEQNNEDFPFNQYFNNQHHQTNLNGQEYTNSQIDDYYDTTINRNSRPNSRSSSRSNSRSNSRSRPSNINNNVNNNLQNLNNIGDDNFDEAEWKNDFNENKLFEQNNENQDENQEQEQNEQEKDYEDEVGNTRTTTTRTTLINNNNDPFLNTLKNTTTRRKDSIIQRLDDNYSSTVHQNNNRPISRSKNSLHHHHHHHHEPISHRADIIADKRHWKRIQTIQNNTALSTIGRSKLENYTESSFPNQSQSQPQSISQPISSFSEQLQNRFIKQNKIPPKNDQYLVRSSGSSSIDIANAFLKSSLGQELIQGDDAQIYEDNELFSQREQQQQQDNNKDRGANFRRNNNKDNNNNFDEDNDTTKNTKTTTTKDFYQFYADGWKSKKGGWVADFGPDHTHPLSINQQFQYQDNNFTL